LLLREFFQTFCDFIAGIKNHNDVRGCSSINLNFTDHFAPLFAEHAINRVCRNSNAGRSGQEFWY
jgi:hypothetical protein